MKIHPIEVEQEKTDEKKFKFSKKLAIIFIVVCVLAVVLAIVLYFTLSTKSENQQEDFQDCLKGHEQYQLSSSSKLGKYKQAAVAADSVACSTVGKDILLANGSAIDAAIATGLCNGLFNPQSMGLGGGHFMLIYLKNEKKVYGIDARERAPLTASENMFVNNTALSVEGGLASGVPGEIAGYWQAYKIGGRLPWKKLFEPSINFCQNGIKVSATLASAIRQNEAKIKNNKGLSNIFINKLTNEIYKENDTMKMLSLGNTLIKISEQGPDAFYNGELTQKIVDDNKINNGLFQIEDLNTYTVSNRTPIFVRLNEKYRLYTLPAPSSGLLVSFILNVMSRFNLTASTLDTIESKVIFYHRLLETFKHAYAKRSFLGDMEFVNITGLVQNLTDTAYINQIVKLIDDSRTFDQAYYGPGWPVKFDSGTAHISIISPDGDAVALTSTINTFFGAKYAGEETGIIYNNEMDDFSTPGTVNFFGVPASEPNFIKPKKRPMSSMSPIIILDENDDVRLVLGASGGTKIITAVSQVAIKNLYLNKNIKESIDESRVHHQLFPIYAEIERGFSSDIQQILTKKGHQTQCFNYGGSTVQGVERRSDKDLWANSDARKGGEADGF